MPQTQQQKTWVAYSNSHLASSKYKVHKLHQRHILETNLSKLSQNKIPIILNNRRDSIFKHTGSRYSKLVVT